MSGSLTLVPTPLGNLGDMTTRALEALREADVVCAEDTRVTGKLLASFGIKKRLERLDENTIRERASSIADRIAAGERVAFCSDAGMPGVSDPGMQLVAAARSRGLEVVVLPGPTAFATAYVASGCPDSTFYFGGFFPRKDNARKELLAQLGGLQAALIFYESPHRVADALRSIAAAMPLRTVTVCRELTKIHEEVYRDSAVNVAQEFAERAQRDAIKGEIVLVIDGPTDAEHQQKAEDAHERARERAINLARAGERGKQISKTVAQEFGLSKNEAYDLALAAVDRVRNESAVEGGDLANEPRL